MMGASGLPPLAAGIGLVAIAGWVDYATGVEVRAFPLYFLPVGLVTYRLGRAAGLAISRSRPPAGSASTTPPGSAVRAVVEGAWRPVTLSIGAVSFAAVPESVDAMVREADALMYRVKAAGKDNLICAVWSGPEPARLPAEPAEERA